MSLVGDVLSRHRVGLTDSEVAAELDAALTAAGEPGAAALSAGEVEYLRDHAGSYAASVVDHWDPDQARQDRGRAVSRRVADTIASSLSITETADLLAVDRSRISHRVKQQTLWGFTLAGNRRIPRWQITAEGLLPGLDHLVPAIPPDVHPLSIDAFMRTPQAELDQHPPLLYLASGGDPQVVADLLADLGRW